MLSSGNKTANIYVKTVQFIETFCKDDIVVSDIKQQRSISNFTVTHCQLGPSDYK